jgi:hypothetical protein
MPANLNAEIKKTALFRHLKAQNGELSKQCLAFVEHITPFLRSIRNYFPYYTRHDDIHSLHIVNRITEIVLPDCFGIRNSLSFNATEAFLLICAAFGHDMGMTILPGEEASILSQLGLERSGNWQTDPSLQEYLRKTHSERGGTYIVNYIDQIGIPIALHQHINLLMRSHNLSITALHTQLGRRFSSESKEIDLLQLASIFCIADLIEYSEDRVLSGVIDQLRDGLNKENDQALLVSLQENLKHNGIGANLGIGKKDGQVIMSGTFKDPDVLNTAYRAVDFIEVWLRDYGDIDYRCGRKRLRIRTDFVATTFDIPGREFNRLGIRMNKQNVIGLISSNALWNSRPEIVIRELLQNAVEACRYRSVTNTSQQYKPQITVEFDQQEHTATISDNGCGMSRSTILNNFLTVGNSHAKESEYALDGYSSLARFGIGFWSTFTIAEKAVVETCEYLGIFQNGEGISFEVSIGVLKEYTLFEKTVMNPGTRIKLYLKSSVVLSELANRIVGRFGVIQCSPIPITISFGEMQTVVPSSPEYPTLNELFGPKTQHVTAEGIELFQYPSEVEDITIQVFIVARKQEGKISFLYSDGSRISIIPSIPTSSSICGFSVNMAIYFPVHEIVPDLIGYIANTDNPRGFEFDINRQGLLPSPRHEQFIQSVAFQLISIYRKFLKDNGCYNTRSIVRLFDEGSAVQRGGILGKNAVLPLLLTIAPDLLCYKLFKVEPSRSIHNCETEYLTYDEIKERGYRILTISRMYSVHSTAGSIYVDDPFFYQLALTMYDVDQPTYFVHRGESNLLFSHDPNSYIVPILIPVSGQKSLYATIFVTHLNTVDPAYAGHPLIGSARGSAWAGLIMEAHIKGANFAFTHQCCHMQIGSELASDVRSLHEKGRYQEIAQLMHRLEASLYGFLDPEVIKYIQS